MWPFRKKTLQELCQKYRSANWQKVQGWPEEEKVLFLLTCNGATEERVQQALNCTFDYYKVVESRVREKIK